MPLATLADLARYRIHFFGNFSKKGHPVTVLPALQPVVSESNGQRRRPSTACTAPEPHPEPMQPFCFYLFP